MYEIIKKKIKQLLKCIKEKNCLEFMKKSILVLEDAKIKVESYRVEESNEGDCLLFLLIYLPLSHERLTLTSKLNEPCSPTMIKELKKELNLLVTLLELKSNHLDDFEEAIKRILSLYNRTKEDIFKQLYIPCSSFFTSPYDYKTISSLLNVKVPEYSIYKQAILCSFVVLALILSGKITEEGLSEILNKELDTLSLLLDGDLKEFYITGKYSEQFLTLLEKILKEKIRKWSDFVRFLKKLEVLYKLR